MKKELRSMVRSLRHKDLFWRYGFNVTPTLRHLLNDAGDLREIESRIVSNLRSDGVAISSVDELFGESDLFTELVSSTADMLRERSEEIDELRRLANNEEAIGAKTFNLELLGSELEFDGDSIFARFALAGPLLRIANAYFRMLVNLRYYNVWQTFASTGASRESQLWHVDREDNRILKLFLYLDDVDEGAGPFTYAPGSQRHGRSSSIKPEFHLEGGVRRTTDDQMKAVFPEAELMRCTGKKGTIVLADTTGYHKGGEARTKDRLMYTCMYTSPASDSKRLIKFPTDFDPNAFDKRQRVALGY